MARPKGRLRFASGSVRRWESFLPMKRGASGNASLHGGVARDVVGMAVGVEDRGQCQAMIFEQAEDRAGIEAGVDDEGKLRSSLPGDVGDFVKGRRDDGLDVTSFVGRHRELLLKGLVKPTGGEESSLADGSDLNTKLGCGTVDSASRESARCL